jgi:hypothetical protein
MAFYFAKTYFFPSVNHDLKSDISEHAIFEVVFFNVLIKLFLKRCITN